ncbi:MAG TPA: trypsin-like peptidase domain-containing protein [Polyangia bacterium]|nr:trypsin-like peptidase domain-containing protein [Polyangia bacterium]
MIRRHAVIPLLACVCVGVAVSGCNRGAGADGRALAATKAPAATNGSSTAVTPKLEPSEQARALSDAFARVAEAIRPSVVRLDVEGSAPRTNRLFDFGGDDQNPFQQMPMPRKVQGTGSGVIIDGAGDILTNSHVVRGARKVTIKLPDQRSFEGRVVGTDPLTDVGVVRFEKPPTGMVAARIGDSDKLRIGEWAIAVGSPLGMDQTVTAGIISGVGETGSRFRFESGERVRKYIQTDAEINPGNSGGPLVSLEGEVIGLNTLINVGPGGSYGFAIPINQASQVASVLIKEGRVRYPYAGVSVMGIGEVPQELLDQVGKNLPKEGGLVISVAPDGPAAAAGIKPGDVIVGVGGHAVKTAGDVVAGVSDQKIGSKVSIDYVRDGAKHAADMKLGEYPGEATPGANRARIGVGLQTLTESIAQSLGLPPRTKGAVITEIEPGSPAEKAGLALGDIIREIDKKPVTNAEDAVAAMASGKGARLLRVTNASGTRFVSVKPE